MSGNCVGATCVPSCDGKVCGDNACGGSCGTCAFGEACDASGQCSAAICSVMQVDWIRIQCLPELEVCDGWDNDCDGLVDENLTNSTTCGQGICAVPFTQTCVAGNWTPSSCAPLRPYYAQFDYNSDALLTDPEDADILRGLLAGNNGCPADKECDVNGDGNITSSDLFVLLNIIAGNLDYGESCDGLDNNCNNQTDEGGACSNGTAIVYPYPEAQLCGGFAVRAVLPYGIDIARFLDNDERFADVAVQEQGFAQATLPVDFARTHGGLDDNAHTLRVEARNYWLGGLFTRWVSEDSINISLDCTSPNITIDPATLADAQLISATKEILTLRAPSDTQSVFFDFASTSNLSDWRQIGYASERLGKVFASAWDTRSAPDGLYAVRATAMDDMRWLASDARFNIRIDNTPPSLTDCSPASGSRVNGTLPFGCSVEDLGSGVDPATFRVLVDDDPSINGLCEFSRIPQNANCQAYLDTSQLADGVHLLRYQIQDNAGNLAQSPPYYVTVRNYPQNVMLLHPEAGSYIYQQNTSAEAIAPAGTARVLFDYSLDQTTWDGTEADPTGSDGWNALMQAPGMDAAYHFRARAFDGNGTLLGADINYPVIVDRMAPDIAFIQPKDGANLSKTVYILVNTTAQDIDHVEFSWSTDNRGYTFIGSDYRPDTVGGVSLYRMTWNTIGLQGDYYLKAQAVDMAGNLGSAQVFVHVYNNPPVVHIVTPRGGTVNGTVHVVYTVDNRVLQGSLQVIIGNRSLVPVCNVSMTTLTCDALWDTTQEQDGSYQITAISTDQLGNSGSDSVSVSVDNTPSPVVIIDPKDGIISTGSFDVRVVAPEYAGRVAFTIPQGPSVPDDSYGQDGWTAAVSTASMDEGEYALTAEAFSTFFIFNTQSLGSDSIRFIVDKTAPSAELSIYSSGFPLLATDPDCTARRDVLLQLNATDNYGVKDCRFANSIAELNSAPWESCTQAKSWLLPQTEGNATVYAQVRDHANNIRQTSDWIRYDSSASCLDTSPPSAPTVIDDGDYTNDPSRFHAYWYGAYDYENDVLNIPLTFRYRMRFDIPPGQSYNCVPMPACARYHDLGAGPGEWNVTDASSLNLSSLSLFNGFTYYLEVQAINHAGQASDTAASDGIIVDTQGPSVLVESSTHPNENLWYNSTLLLLGWREPSMALLPQAPIAGYSFTLDASNDTVPDDILDGPAGQLAVQNSTSFTLADGIWYFHIKAKDTAGNWGPTAVFAVHVDRDIGFPIITVRKPLGVTRSNTPEIQIGTNKQTDCTLRLIEPDQFPYNTTLPFNVTGSVQHSVPVILGEGNYTFNYTCTDFRGAQGSVLHTFLVDPKAQATNLTILTIMNESTYSAGQTIDIIVEALIFADSKMYGLDGLDGQIDMIINGNRVATQSTGMGDGLYLVQFKAPTNTSDYNTAQAISLGEYSDVQIFRVAGFSLTVQYREAAETVLPYVIAHKEGDKYIIGIASEALSSHGNAGSPEAAMTMTTNPLAGKTFVFLTVPYANINQKDSLLSLEGFLSQSRPSFGLPGRDSNIVSAEVSQPLVKVTGERQVGPGRYKLVLRNMGKAEDGRTIVEVTVI